MPRGSIVTLWNKIWQRNADIYYKTFPRMGLIVYLFLDGTQGPVLELGSGSGRDLMALSLFGVESTVGVDLSTKAVEIASKRSISMGLSTEFVLGDAFNLPLRDESFSLSYHSGLLGLFDDNRAAELLREQSRVTNRKIIIFVHNARNERLMEIFRIKSKENKLYDIRFFHLNELMNVVRSVSIGREVKSIRVYKFGSPIDALLRGKLGEIIMRLGRKKTILRIVAQLIFLVYQLTPWRYVERIMLVIEK